MKLVSTTALLCALMLVLLLSSGDNNYYHVAAQAHGNVTYDIQILPTFYRRVRVTFTGVGFDNNTFFALSSTAQCNNGAPGGLPDNLTAPVQWTWFDRPTSFVAAFEAWTEAPVAYACVSRDAGNRFYMAQNLKGRYNFRLWGKVPTAKIAPLYPIANSPLQVYVRNLPANSQALLTTNAGECDAASPGSLVPGVSGPVTMVAVDATTGVFGFLPQASAGTAYVCVATPAAFTDWTLAPYDENDVIVYREWNYDNKPDPYDQVTDRMTFTHFKIHSDANQWRRVELACDPLFVQGHLTRCWISMWNVTVVPTAPADWAFLALHDGAGVAECPFPLLVAENATHIYFDWMPQRWGREGMMAFTYQTLPIRMENNWFNDAALLLPTNSSFREANDTTDPLTRFLVLPPDTYASDYAAVANLLAPGDFTGFAPLAGSFVVTVGNADQMANAAATPFEPSFATLDVSKTTATMSRTLSGLAAQARCKFGIKYAFFPAAGVPDYTMTSLVGRASIVARDASNADIGTVRDMYVYVQGTSVVVTGTGLNPLGVTGDIRTVESLSAEFPWRSDFAGFRFELQIYHDSQQRFYWTEPQFHCIPPASGGQTLAADVAALQALFNTFDGQKLVTLNWRNPAGTAWNGDPCINKWVGVLCRNARVVELHLVDKKLSGAVDPAIGNLLMLEVLRLNHNEFAGGLPDSLQQLTRLRTFDVSNNILRSIPPTFASVTTNRCLRRIFAHRNQLTVFPNQTIDSLSLETLRLEWNQIEGTLPNFTNADVPLREFSVAHNKFYDYMPPTIPFQSLVVFDLSDNRFTGPIPVEWGSLVNIQYLDISHNRIEGGVPAEMASIRSGAMLTFRAQDNFIGGLVPRLPFQSYDLRQNIIACPFAVAEDFANEFGVKGLLYDECDYASLAQFAIPKP